MSRTFERCEHGVGSPGHHDHINCHDQVAGIDSIAFPFPVPPQLPGALPGSQSAPSHRELERGLAPSSWEPSGAGAGRLLSRPCHVPSQSASRNPVCKMPCGTAAA